MNQASIFFRVFDLAFFAPGLVVLLPVWLMTHPTAGGAKLDVVSGVMTAGAWILLSYAVGLLVHGLGRLVEAWAEQRPQGRKMSLFIAALMLLLIGFTPWVSVPWLQPPLAVLALAAALHLGRAFGRARHPVLTDIDAAQGASMLTHFDRVKQQELGLYFWYLRATSNNIAYAIPLAFGVWVALGQILAPMRPLEQTRALVDPTDPVVLLGGLALGALAAFILAASGREYHQAWKHARVVLGVSQQTAHDLAVKTATKT